MTHLMRSAIAVVLISRLAPGRVRWAVPMLIALWVPLVGVAFAGAVAALAVRHRAVDRRRAGAAVTGELAVLAEVLAIGLTAGMAPAEALAFASQRLESELAVEVETVRRGMARSGAAAAMSGAGGAAGRLYVLIGRAMASGAPVLAAVERYGEERRAEDRAAREAALRRLPVLLAFPLALLILPGFVLLVVAPALAGALERLGL